MAESFYNDIIDDAKVPDTVDVRRLVNAIVTAERNRCIAAIKSVRTSYEAQDRILFEAVLAIRALG